MDDRALWSACFRLLDLIDPACPSYSPGKIRDGAGELRQVLVELRKRGTQLSFFPPAS